MLRALLLTETKLSALGEIIQPAYRALESDFWPSSFSLIPNFHGPGSADDSLVVMVFLLPEQLEPQRDHWHFGYEAGRIARSIAQGGGFSSPLFEDTGPTAWMTPVYPYLVAGVFKLFGVYTKTSAIVLLSLNALMSALVCIPIFEIARISFGERVAKWSAWGVGIFPLRHLFSRRAHLGNLARDPCFSAGFS